MVDHVDVPKGWRLAAGSFGEKRERRRHAMAGDVFGVLIWSGEDGEGEVLLAPWFTKECWILKGDALQDCTGLLDREYDSLIKDDIGPANAVVAAALGLTPNPNWSEIKAHSDAIQKENEKLREKLLALTLHEEAAAKREGLEPCHEAQEARWLLNGGKYV